MQTLNKHQREREGKRTVSNQQQWTVSNQQHKYS